MASVILHLPITHKRPEQIRVVELDNLYLVEIYGNNTKTWITQAEWVSARNAMQDALAWYGCTTEERLEAFKISNESGYN